MSNVLDGGSPANQKWVAVMGNGLNSTAGVAKLFVLFVDDGVDGWGPGDFVKIDTEGWDAKIIAGGSEMIRACRPNMLIEFNRERMTNHHIPLEPAWEFLINEMEYRVLRIDEAAHRAVGQDLKHVSERASRSDIELPDRWLLSNVGNGQDRPRPVNDPAASRCHSAFVKHKSELLLLLKMSQLQ